MSDLPPIDEESRKKAATFFERGATVAGTGNYDFAISMYMMGLDKNPDAVEAHQALLEISLKRKASGGKGLGMWDAMKLKKSGKDEKQNLLAAEKLMAHDPGNTDHMLWFMQSAYKLGLTNSVMWIGPMLYNAIVNSGKPDFKKLIAMKDIYKAIAEWKMAIDMCQAALQIRPEDGELNAEMKNLSAHMTMKAGNYEKGGSFTDSIKDLDGQQKLLNADKDVRTDDLMNRQIADAETEWRAQPDEPGKIMKLVEALVKTENVQNENRAIDLLTATFNRTKQFRFRLAVGKIKMMQLTREQRVRREKLNKSSSDEALKEEYKQFMVNKTEEELKEYTLFAENYPTDLSYKYEMSRRLFSLGRFDEAIPVLQTARQDPKIRVDAATMLARAFLEAGFVDESVDTLRDLIEEYPVKGDAKSKEMYYWYARSLELHNDSPAAIKAYSQLAQWDFNYADVQKRIKELRKANPPGGNKPAT